MDEAERQRRRKDGTDKLHRAIGEFVVNFEHACSGAQSCVLWILQRAGLHNQRITQILLAQMTAEPLRALFQSLMSETQKLTAKEAAIVKNAVDRLQALTEERNDIVHSTWFIGWGNEKTVDFSQAHGMRYHKNKKGAALKSFGRKAEDFEQLTREAEALTNIFRRLSGCISAGSSIEKNFKVAADGTVAVPDGTA